MFPTEEMSHVQSIVEGDISQRQPGQQVVIFSFISWEKSVYFFLSFFLSLWLISTLRAEPETVISRAWVQSPDPAE